MTEKNEYVETKIIGRIKRKKNNNSNFYNSLTEEEKEAFEIYINLRKEKYEEKAKNKLLEKYFNNKFPFQRILNNEKINKDKYFGLPEKRIVEKYLKSNEYSDNFKEILSESQ